MEADKCDQCRVLEGRLELAKIKIDQLVLEKEALNLELRDFNFNRFVTPNVVLNRECEEQPSAELQPEQEDSPPEDQQVVMCTVQENVEQNHQGSTNEQEMEVTAIAQEASSSQDLVAMDKTTQVENHSKDFSHVFKPQQIDRETATEQQATANFESLRLKLINDDLKDQVAQLRKALNESQNDNAVLLVRLCKTRHLLGLDGTGLKRKEMMAERPNVEGIELLGLCLSKVKGLIDLTQRNESKMKRITAANSVRPVAASADEAPQQSLKRQRTGSEDCKKAEAPTEKAFEAVFSRFEKINNDVIEEAAQLRSEVDRLKKTQRSEKESQMINTLQSKLKCTRIKKQTLKSKVKQLQALVELSKVGEMRKEIVVETRQTAISAAAVDTNISHPVIENKRDAGIDKLEFLEKTLTEVTGQVVQLQLELEVSRSQTAIIQGQQLESAASKNRLQARHYQQKTTQTEESGGDFGCEDRQQMVDVIKNLLRRIKRLEAAS